MAKTRVKILDVTLENIYPLLSRVLDKGYEYWHHKKKFLKEFAKDELIEELKLARNVDKATHRLKASGDLKIVFKWNVDRNVNGVWEFNPGSEAIRELLLEELFPNCNFSSISLSYEPVRDRSQVKVQVFK